MDNNAVDINNSLNRFLAVTIAKINSTKAPKRNVFEAANTPPIKIIIKLSRKYNPVDFLNIVLSPRTISNKKTKYPIAA